MHEFLNNYYREYICFGDKTPIPSKDLFCRHLDKIFFCIRDVRAWIAEKAVKKLYHVKRNIVHAGVDSVIQYHLNPSLSSTHFPSADLDSIC
jgi:hypothetical protein